MVRHTNCSKYRKWKREQLKKSKRKRKKVKEEKPKEVLDCLDDDDYNDDGKLPKLKTTSRKCKKKRKRRKPRDPKKYIYKQVPVSDLILKHIQPSIEQRRLILYERHNACLENDPPDSAPRGCGQCKKPKKVLEDPDSESSECDSICSFHSEVCLAGVKLTAADRKKLKEYQQES